MDLIREHMLKKINDNIGIAVTKARMTLEPFLHVYPPNLIDATNKMLDEIYYTEITLTDTKEIDKAIDKYLKATKRYVEEEAKDTISNILNTVVKDKIEPIIEKYCTEAPKLVCSPKIYDNFCDYVLNEVLWNLRSVYKTEKIVDTVMSSWRYHEIEDFEI